LLTPVVLLFNLVLLGVAPGMTAAWLASLLIQFAFGAEGAAGHALLVRTPGHMRGRVGTFVMGTLPQVGYLTGCGLIFGAHFVTDLLHWSGKTSMYFTVAIGVTAALTNVWAGSRLRRAFAEGPVVA
jgi:hypothetical protein